MEITYSDRVDWFLNVAIPSVATAFFITAKCISDFVDSGDLASAEDEWEENFDLPLYERP